MVGTGLIALCQSNASFLTSKHKKGTVLETKAFLNSAFRYYRLCQRKCLMRAVWPGIRPVSDAIKDARASESLLMHRPDMETNKMGQTGHHPAEKARVLHTTLIMNCGGRSSRDLGGFQLAPGFDKALLAFMLNAKPHIRKPGGPNPSHLLWSLSAIV